MPLSLNGLTEAQHEAVMHRGGPLLVLGGAGTGKTRTLLARFMSLVEHGTPPEGILVLAHASATADALRARLEDMLDRPYEELAVYTPAGLCARLLADEALEAGIDPFLVPATAADRLAMLIEHVDELTLRQHDFRGRPTALIASFVARIDRLKAQLVSADEYSAWAAGLPPEDSAHTAREREFAQVYAQHERLLAAQGVLDYGDLLMRVVRLLRDNSEVRARVTTRFEQLLIGQYEEYDFGATELVGLLAGEGRGVTVYGDDDQAIDRFRGVAAKNLRDFQAAHVDAKTVRLERSMRCPAAILTAARAVVAPNGERLDTPLVGGDGGDVHFWRCVNERTEAQSVAADVERLISRAGVAPEQIAVLVRSVANEGQPIAVALAERAVPHRVVGATAFFQRAEVRDVLAWLRLLSDPGDAGAVVRALARPPIELRSIDLARCIQIARRRKLDMVSGLVAATESPQLPPEARERILRFLKLHRAAIAALDTQRPDLFVHRLIDRLGLRRQQLFAASPDVAERLVNLARLGELAAAYVGRVPQATPREFARYIAAVADAGLREEQEYAPAGGGRAVRVMAIEAAKGLEFDHVYVLGLHASRMPGARRRGLEPLPDALLHEQLPSDSRAIHVAEMRRLLHVAMTRARRRLVLAYAAASERGAVQPPSPFVEQARAALSAEWEDREEELFGPAETLHATLRALRDELLDSVARIGGRIGELRLDTDLDLSHGVVRYLELLKLAALAQRPEGHSIADALPDLNARLLQAATPLQREILLTSTLDELLLGAEGDELGRARAIAARDEPSLEAFLPKRGEGLLLSASDIETYRTCPLKYKFARVFRIPAEPTLNQRFGILVHHVLERYHASDGRTLDGLVGLLDAGWRRGGFGDSEEERQLRVKVTSALTTYHRRCGEDQAEPTWFERPFSFSLGPHQLRGRVDRIDRLPAGGFELIDYKTGVPKTASQLKDDVQLSLYAIGAREAWQLEAAAQSYYYVLDDQKVPLAREAADLAWVKETAMEVADGILSQGFEPTPSYAACSMCDYRIACPAAEK